MSWTASSASEQEALELFQSSGALQKGHFILRSGLHSEFYFQCARAGEDMPKVTRLVELFVPMLTRFNPQTILAPAMGGLVFGQEVARQMNLRYLFAEKADDNLQLRRGFQLNPGERVLVVEDVITKGGRVAEALSIVKQHGGEPVGVGVLVDRSGGECAFEAPYQALVNLNFPVYEPDELPNSLAQIEPVKPGS